MNFQKLIFPNAQINWPDLAAFIVTQLQLSFKLASLKHIWFCVYIYFGKDSLVKIPIKILTVSR